jgi:hypothetical protein
MNMDGGPEVVDNGNHDNAAARGRAVVFVALMGW